MIVPDTHFGRLKAWLRGWPRSRVRALVEGRDSAGHFYTNIAAHSEDMAALEETCAAHLAESGAVLVEIAEAQAGSQRIPPDRDIVETTGRAYFQVDVSVPEREQEHV